MMMEQDIAHVMLIQKQKQLLMKAKLMIYLNQSIVQLIQICKNVLENIRAGSLIRSLITL